MHVYALKAIKYNMLDNFKTINIDVSKNRKAWDSNPGYYEPWKAN